MPTMSERYAELQRWSPPLAQATMICLGLLLVALAGLVVDHRVITNAPAWLKPAKFAVSVPVFTGTLAYLVRDLPRTRSLRVATTLIGWLLVVEVVLILIQAARGTTSHFNVSTPLNRAIFSAMGIGIATVWIMSMVLLWQHLRTPAVDRAMALALRIGLALNLLGAGIGWTMTQPRPEQLAALQHGEPLSVFGSHTVGAPDGGPGLPITRWSTDHGDLRIPHFVGMHALQLLPLLLLALRRWRTRRDDGVERGLILLASTACAALFFAAFVQAMQGHPLLSTVTS